MRSSQHHVTQSIGWSVSPKSSAGSLTAAARESLAVSGQDERASASDCDQVISIIKSKALSPYSMPTSDSTIQLRSGCIPDCDGERRQFRVGSRRGECGAGRRAKWKDQEIVTKETVVRETAIAVQFGNDGHRRRRFSTTNIAQRKRNWPG